MKDTGTDCDLEIDVRSTWHSLICTVSAQHMFLAALSLELQRYCTKALFTISFFGSSGVGDLETISPPPWEVERDPLIVLFSRKLMTLTGSFEALERKPGISFEDSVKSISSVLSSKARLPVGRSKIEGTWGVSACVKGCRSKQEIRSALTDSKKSKVDRMQVGSGRTLIFPV